MEGGEGGLCFLCGRDNLWGDFLLASIGEVDGSKDTHFDDERVGRGKDDK